MEQEHPTGPVFDTLKAAEALQQAGFTGVQARAVTQTIVEAQDNLASKADIRELRTETKAEFKTLRAEMKAEFKAQRADNKRMEETLRAENKRMEEKLRAEMAELRADTRAEFKGLRAEVAELRADTRAEFKELRAEVQALNKVVSTLEKLIWGVTVPMIGGIFVAVVSFAVDHFFFSG